MKAQELRINNWVKHPKGHYLRVSEILRSLLSVKGPGGVRDELIYSDVSPIPLTTEILEKCGFEFEDNDSSRYGWYKRLNKHFWFSWCHLEFISIEDSDSNVLIDIPCSYVHQLQNISYDFTGEELEFKP